jgi:hypothetical protein
VVVDGDTRPAGSWSSTSIRYFAYNAAWSLDPRAASSANLGRLAATSSATCAYSSRRATIESNTAGCSATSSAIRAPAVDITPPSSHIRSRPMMVAL